MPEQMGLTQFFAMEAGDYLDRLDAAVSKTPEPDRGELVRLTRALRGSALMANQQAFAQAASGLERLARLVHDRSRPWDAATKQVAVRAVDDLKILVRKATTWSHAYTQKANQIAATLPNACAAQAKIIMLMMTIIIHLFLILMLIYVLNLYQYLLIYEIMNYDPIIN